MAIRKTDIDKIIDESGVLLDLQARAQLSRLLVDRLSPPTKYAIERDYSDLLQLKEEHVKEFQVAQEAFEIERLAYNEKQQQDSLALKALQKRCPHESTRYKGAIRYTHKCNHCHAPLTKYTEE